ncbi:hypothetical protein [Streptomyces sp. BPTC-684]|uniref:hypothetical protein n=1 Tax=Streptomyces sp. BPTC-684 TaxID=3043734 RepID=UPI0024B0E539|nr:hypothetical protein [Streptomyces sp. BPTC-684]WHM38133.1 hypothetical protein QIY60_15225 [Streptomyces sp. BPTC-684]
MDHVRHRRYRIVPATLFVVGLLLTGCSSGSDESPSPPGDTSQTEEPTAPPPPEPTKPTEGTSGQQDNGGTDGSSGGSGGFNTAGRISTNFQGVWPEGTVELSNPTDETYTGTATIYDCSPTNRWTNTLPAKSVTLAPHGDSDTVSFSFKAEDTTQPTATHVVCLSLTGSPSPASSSFPDQNFTSPDENDEPEPPASPSGVIPAPDSS